MRSLLADLRAETPEPAYSALAEVLIPALVLCPDPDRAMLNLLAFCRASGGMLSLATDLVENPDLRHSLLRVLGHSQVFANVLTASPEWLDVVRMVRAERPARADLVRGALASYQAMPTRLSRLNALRRFRKRAILRIGTSDILERWEFGEVVAGISDLADACLEACLALAESELLPQHGAPLDAEGRRIPFTAMALGKLGGRELNYASDVDVLFVCGGPGETEGPRRIPALDYFDKLARTVLSSMSEPLEEGFLFRADARLRPEGKSGPLVRTLEGCRIYYESYGRAWERQALIKARPAAGDPALGDEFVSVTRSFVFGRRIDDADLRELVRLKAQRESRVRLSGREELDVKHGPGGIRDIEYIVQLLQLGAGETTPQLRSANTLAAAAALAEAGALTPPEARLLREAYVLLRRAEHAVQIRDERQTHELPADPEEREVLARRLGYRTARELDERLRDLRSSVRAIYEEVASGAGRLGEVRRSPLQAYVLGLGDARAAEELAGLGFADPPCALETLARMATPAGSLDDAPGEALADVVDEICHQSARSGDPDAALSGLDSLTVLSGGRRRFYRMLREEPRVAELLAMLAGRSRFLTRALESHPELLDSLLDPALLTSPRRLEGYLEIVGDGLGVGRLGPLCEQLRRVRRRELLRTGLRDVAGLNEVHETHREITCLAEACFTAGVSAACEEAGLDPSGLAIVALGSFGGYELHFSSDLDVVFALAPGREPSGGEAYARAMRAVLKAFSEPTQEGALFPVDARLRPEGQNGPLVPSWSAIETYMHGRGQAWERIAATRARGLGPSREAGERLVAAYAGFAYSAPLAADERAEVDHIRGRIEQERERSEDEQLDLKLCRGGLIDLEFAVRIAQIEAGAQTRSVRAPGLREAIRLLARVRAIPPALSESLSRAWRLLRGLEMRLQVVHEQPSGVLDMSDAALAMMGRQLHMSVSEKSLSGDELRERISAARSVVRDTFERVIAGGTDGLRTRRAEGA